MVEHRHSAFSILCVQRGGAADRAGLERVALTVLRTDGAHRIAIDQPFTAERVGTSMRAELASTEDVVVNLAHLLLLSVENKGLVMTGRSPLISPWK